MTWRGSLGEASWRRLAVSTRSEMDPILMRLSMSTVSLMRLCAKSSMHRTLTSPWEDLWETPNLRVYGGRARGPGGRRGAMRPSLMSSKVWAKTLSSASESPGSAACCLRRESAIVSARSWSSSRGMVACRTSWAGAIGETGIFPTSGKPEDRCSMRSSASLCPMRERYLWMRATLRPEGLAAMRTDLTVPGAPSMTSLSSAADDFARSRSLRSSRRCRRRSSLGVSLTISSTHFERPSGRAVLSEARDREMLWVTSRCARMPPSRTWPGDPLGGMGIPVVGSCRGRISARGAWATLTAAGSLRGGSSGARDPSDLPGADGVGPEEKSRGPIQGA